MRTITHYLTVVAAFFFCLSTHTSAQTPKQKANTRITNLKTLIEKAEKKGIDVTKEKMSLNTANIFMKYANWDAEHVSENKAHYVQANGELKINAQKYANNLADFERNEIVNLLDESISFLDKLIAGKVKRKTIRTTNWNTAKVTNDCFTQGGKPIFLSDYVWKADANELKQYGNSDGFYITPSYVIDKSGKINTNKLAELKAKSSNRIGSIFINHKNIPQWSLNSYGSDFNLGKGVRYTEYDIDNPGARKMMGFLLDGMVPEMKGKRFSKLGYMLCNEPHFYTTKQANGKLDWASSTVTNYTKAKFKTWLKNKHSKIGTLNSLWGTNFASFDKVTISIPISVAKTGTPMWYDWVTFNAYRVTDWYTFMKNKIVANDPNAKVHLKIMPNLWSENKRGHGIDLEALTRLSGIIGNDAGATHSPLWGSNFEWETHYAFEWREMCMSYDFMKSVSPNKPTYNSETHYLSTNRSRKLDLDPAYARATYWMAFTQGLSASHTWFWPRLEDGSIKSNVTEGYAASNIQQPHVTNEVESTVMDVNTFADEVMAMQRQEKPIRIFYSETSATNKTAHMDDVFELYESLFFEGIPIGFATKDIITKQKHDWETILIYKTEYLTKAERNALQAYLNKGGTVIMDAVSCKKNEYGKSLARPSKGSGKIIYVSSLSAMKTKALQLVASSAPSITIKETNSGGSKGCTWKCVKDSDGKLILSIVNLGKTKASLKISSKDGKSIGLTNLFDGQTISTTTTLKPLGLLFCEIGSPNNADIIKSTTAPSSLNKAKEVSFTVNYESSTLRDIHVGLQNKDDWKSWGAVTKTVQGSGSTSFSFTPKEGLPAGDNYRWIVYMTPKGEDWSKKIGDNFYKNTKVEDNIPIGETIWLKSVQNGKYVSTKKNTQNAPVKVNTSTFGSWEQYSVADAGNGKIALKSKSNNLYLSAINSNTEIPIQAVRSSIGTWEKFEWISLTNNRIALKASINGKYLSTTNVTGNPLCATAGSLTNREKFLWGSNSLKSIGVVNSESIEKSEINQKVSVYPMPFQEFVNVKLPSDHAFTTLEVISMNGTVVATTNIKSQKSSLPINLNHLDRGFYILKLSGGGSIKTVKIAKQ